MAGAASKGGTTFPRSPPGSTRIDWPSFMARADMIWEHDNRSLPTSWGEAAFTGNGLLSVAAVYQPRGDTLQFELGRADVWACGRMPMLPIGAVEWR